MYKGRRIISFLLAFCMLFGQLPLLAFAQPAETTKMDSVTIDTPIVNADGTTTVEFAPDFDETDETQGAAANQPVMRSMMRAANATQIDWSQFLVTYQIDLSTFAPGGAGFPWDEVMAGVDNTFTITQIDPDTNERLGTQTLQVNGTGIAAFAEKVRVYNDNGNKYRYALTMPGDVVLKSTILSVSSSGKYDSQTDPKTYTVEVQYNRLASTEFSSVWNVHPDTTKPVFTGIFNGFDSAGEDKAYEFNIPVDGSTVLREDFTSRPTDQKIIDPQNLDTVGADQYSIALKTMDETEVTIGGTTYQGTVVDGGTTFYVNIEYDEITGGVYTFTEQMTVKFYDGTAPEAIETVNVPYNTTFTDAGTVPAAPTPPAGKTFAGWFTDLGAANEAAFDPTAVVDKNLTVTAKFTDKIVPVEDPDDEVPTGYHRVVFHPGTDTANTHGQFKAEPTKYSIAGGTYAGQVHFNVLNGVTFNEVKAVMPNTAEMTVDTGWAVNATEPWTPAIPADDHTGAPDYDRENYYVQYTDERETTIPVDDPNTPTPDGYVRVVMSPGENGTLTEKAGTTKQADGTVLLDVKVDTVILDKYVPTIEANEGYTVADPAWDPDVTAPVTAAGTFTAQYDQNVIPTDPEDPQTPEGYVLVKFEAGTDGTFAADAKTAFNVKEGTPFSEVKAVMPTATANEGFSNNGWAPELPADDAAVTEAATYVAQYTDERETTIPVDDPNTPTPDGYVRVVMSPGENGTLTEKAGTTKQADGTVLLDVKVDTVILDKYVPTIEANEGYTVADPAWDPDVTAPVTAAGTFTAQYNKNVIPVDPSEEPTVDPIVEGDKEITGGGVPGSEIEITIPGVDEPIKTTVDDDGTWTGTVPEGTDLKPGEVVTVVQIEKDKDPSDPVKETVIAKSDALTVDATPAQYGDATDYKVTFSGTGTAGATITITLGDGSTFTTTVDEDGKWTATSEQITTAIHEKLGFVASPKVVDGVAVDVNAADPVADILAKIEAAGIGKAMITQTEEGKAPSDAVEAKIERLDHDDDKLYDDEEAFVHNTRVRNPDQDGDMLKDGEEIYGYMNSNYGYKATRPRNADQDGDNVIDGMEVLMLNRDPLHSDPVEF